MGSKAEEQLQQQTAATAFQLVWGGLKDFGSLIVDENAIQRGMKEYARRFLERYGNIKVLNMDQPVPLQEIYVAALVISSRSVRRFSSVDDLHELFLQQGERRLSLEDRHDRKQDCLELANKVQFLNVLGAPGAGKSTFLRRLGLEALLPRRTWSDSLRRTLGLRPGLEDGDRSKYEHNVLPIFLELRRFRTSDFDLVQLVQSELATCGLPESDKLAKALLEGGRLLLLLDGVDEVPGDRLDKAIGHIRDFIDRYSGNRFVVSCRTAFYKGYFSRFRDVLLTDFDDEQIASFVNNWFRSEEDRKRGIAAEFLRTLGEPSNASAKELANTPLLLTFLCLTYDDRQRLPPNRSELYRQALEILMERWAASKRVHNEPVYRELHARLEVQMLAEIAASAYRDNRYFFTSHELIERITEFLRNELNAPKQLDGAQVLHAIEVQQGLIVQRAQDAWSFSHLTLQEYLTAVWYKDGRRTDELVSKNLFDLRWREVFILLAGAVDEAGELLKRMQRSAEKKMASSPVIVQLLQWASNRVVPTESVEETAARRVFALNIAIAIARGIALDFDPNLDFDYDLYSEFDPDLNLDRARAQARARVLDRAFDLSLAVDLKLSSNLDLLISSSLGLTLNRGLDDDPDLDFAIKRARDRHAFATCTESILASFARFDSSRILLGSWAEAGQHVPAMREQIGRYASVEDTLKAWRRALDILADALQMPPELRNLENVWDSLEAQLRVCQLLVDCRNAATRVSRTSWEHICQRILTLPGRSIKGSEQGGRNERPR